MALPFPPADARLEARRADLPALGAGIHLDTGSAGPLPVAAADAMADLAGWELRTGRASPAYDLEMDDRMDETRAVVAAALTAGLDDVALTASASQAMAAAILALPWAPGDRVVTTDAEHPGLRGPLLALRDRGVGLAEVSLATPDDPALLEALDAAIVPGTRLVAISHVTWATGQRLPIGAVAALARDRRALVLVDGAQAAGAIEVDVGTSGADVYVTTGRKWLLGPAGVGALWVRPGLAAELRPAMPGERSFESIGPTGVATLWPTARRFDGASFAWSSIVGLGRSVGWLSMAVGLPAAWARATELARVTADRLAAIEGVEVLTPTDRMATLVAFRIGGWTAEAALAELESRVFAIARAIPSLDAVRISVGWFSTPDELETFVGCVELLAGHRPETLPPRRRLEILGG